MIREREKEKEREIYHQLEEMTLVHSAKFMVGLESLPRDDVLFKLLLPKLDINDW